MDADAEAACIRAERAFAQERWFEAHEHWEAAWRILPPGASRERAHGLLHLAVALFQHARGNSRGAMSQLGKARRRLAEHPDLTPRIASVAAVIERPPLHTL